jgi:hypothetical protein
MLMRCACVFSLHRESLDMILGDEPLILEVVLSHNVSHLYIFLLYRVNHILRA